MNSPLVPVGVQSYFNKEKDVELELQMLRHFFDSWHNLHSLPQDKDHRKKAEGAIVLIATPARGYWLAGLFDT